MPGCLPSPFRINKAHFAAVYPKIRTTYSIKDGEGVSIEFVLADENGTDVPMAIKDCGLEGDGREVTLDGLELL